MAKGVVRQSSIPVRHSPPDRALTLIGCLIVFLGLALSLRLVPDVDVLACLTSTVDLSPRCPVPRTTLAYRIVGALARSADAGIRFSLLRMVLIGLGIAGVTATIFLTRVNRLGASIAGYGWLLLAEPHWSIGYPIILFPLISWLWFLITLRGRGDWGDWIWIPFFFIWTLFSGPAVGLILLVVTSRSVSMGLYRLGYSLLGSAMGFIVTGVGEWMPTILWPIQLENFDRSHAFFGINSSPTIMYAVGFSGAVLFTLFSLVRSQFTGGSAERRVLPILLAYSLVDVRMLTCASVISVIQWARWCSAINLPRRAIHHLKLHYWLLPLCLALDIARVVTNTKYLAEGRPERFRAGFDLLSVPVHGAQWLLAHQVAEGGLITPSLRLVTDWLVLTGQTPATSHQSSEAALFTEQLSAQNTDMGLAPYGYLALSHRDPLQANILHRVGSNPSWRLVYADYLTAVYTRTDGTYRAIPELKVGQMYDNSMLPSALKSIQPIQGYREKVARWVWMREPPPGEAYYFGSFLLAAGKAREARDVLIFASLQSPNASEVLRSLGEAAERLGEAEIAERAFGLSLMVRSHDTNLRARFEEAGASVLRQQKLAEAPPHF